MALTKVTGELVDIGDLDISNVGSIQLDSIAGDADSNTSITFSGSDVITVATGGSTAATFNADQTTTFSGAISGTSATFTTADNTDTLSLISTDADANQGPILNLYRNSSSPADSDSLGRITFDGKNDAGEVVEYARVFSKILDASDGTEDGTFTINRMVAGTSRAIMTAIESETVFNEASQDIDFRIESDGNANMFFLDASANKIYIGDNASHTDDFLQIETPASGGGHGIQIRRNDSNTDQGIGRILFGNNTDTDLVQIHAKTDGANDNGALIFSTQPDGGSLTERMRITHDGDVGIGTTSPSTKLHLEDSSANSIVQLTWKNDARDWRLGVHGGVSDSLVLYDNTASATRMVVNSSGNVGIGTASPAKPLHIYSADNQLVRIESSDAYAGIELKDNTSNASPPLISGVGDALVFYQHNGTDYAERMRLHTDGNVGIGTASPSATDWGSAAPVVQISGTQPLLSLKDTDVTDGEFQLANSGQNFYIYDAAASATRLLINPDGNVGIAESAPDAKLTVAGTNRGATATNVANATGNEKQIYLIEGSKGARVGEWIHSSDAASSPTQTTMYSWYKFVLPGGYSGAGTPGFLEITNHMTGKHASGAAVEQYKILFPNAGSNNSAHGGMDQAYVDKVYAVTRNVGSYTTSCTADFYYLDTGSGTSGATMFMRVTHAAREPFFTMHARYIGGHGHNQGYHQYMAFLGTAENNDHAPADITQLTVNTGQGVQ